MFYGNIKKPEQLRNTLPDITICLAEMCA